jgi:putative intracellular protease/amidase
VVDRVVDDVFNRGLVLLLRFDHLRPEPAAEDVVAPAVALVERPCVGTVEIAHPIGEVRDRGFDYQVVVVTQEAARVHPPAVTALDAAQDVHEDHAVPVVGDDRLLVVPARRDVVVRAGGEVTMRSTHRRRR